MATFESVEEVPVLRQSDYPTLPIIPERTTLVPFDSTWKNVEKEQAAGVIITVCALAGEWKSVSTSNFLELLHQSGFRFTSQGIVNAIWEFADQGLISMVQVDETQYLVPKPELVSVALSNPDMFRLLPHLYPQK